MALNVVELMQEPDSDCAFDQPCKFGHRVEGHAVYCHNDNWEDSPRKCRRTWYTGGKVNDEDCPGFQPNDKFTGSFTKTPIAAPLCQQCGGTKLINTDRGKTETCPRCMGDGSDPHAIPMTTFEQDTLETGWIGSSRNPAQYDYCVRIAETQEQRAAIERLLDLKLISLRSITYTDNATVWLIKLTPKGDAVMNANWAANERDTP